MDEICASSDYRGAPTRLFYAASSILAAMRPVWHVVAGRRGGDRPMSAVSANTNGSRLYFDRGPAGWSPTRGRNTCSATRSRRALTWARSRTGRGPHSAPGASPPSTRAALRRASARVSHIDPNTSGSRFPRTGETTSSAIRARKQRIATRPSGWIPGRSRTDRVPRFVRRASRRAGQDAAPQTTVPVAAASARNSRRTRRRAAVRIPGTPGPGASGASPWCATHARTRDTATRPSASTRARS